MGKYSSTSFIGNILYSLYSYLLSSYTYRVLQILLNWCKHSKVNQLLVNYLLRSSSLKNSVTFRSCSKIFSYIDSLWDGLYKFGVKSGKTSCVVAFIRKTFNNSSSSIAYSIFALFFSCGFGVTSILLGTFSYIKAILLVLGLLVSVLLLVEKSRWMACLRGSLFWHIAIYIFD